METVLMLSKQEEQEERRQVPNNDRRVRDQASTLHQFAEADASTSLGRFSAISSPDVVGSTAAIRYPAGAAWTRDDQGLEPSTGYAINDLVGDAPPPLSKGRTFRRF